MNVIKSLCLGVFFCCMLKMTAQTTDLNPKTTPFSIGESVSLFSKVLQEERTLNIYLPQSYEANSEKKYPVIYLLDGSADEDFIHMAGLVQFGSFSWINMIPETIVVGISNVDRKRDFTFPTQNAKDKADFPTTGGSKNFITYLEQEVQPFIESTYATLKKNTLIGQSLGGLLAAEIALKRPELFDNYIIVSPSIWWDDESLLTSNPAIAQAPKKIFVAVGKEGPIMESGAMKIYLKLKDLYPKNPNIHFKFLEAQDHGDTLHLAAYHAFETLFSEEEKPKTP